MNGSNKTALIGIFFLHSVCQQSSKKLGLNSAISNNSVEVYTRASIHQAIWQWLAAIPSNVNPASDNNGANCAKNQAGPVWFLAGSVTGKLNVLVTSPLERLFYLLSSKYFNSQINKNAENLFELGLSDLHC